MDLLYECAQAFLRLAQYEYHIIIGRKGVKHSFLIAFDKTEFHHLAGLHKLKDNNAIKTKARLTIMNNITKGNLTLKDIEKSAFYAGMAERLSALIQLEKLLDDNKIIFRYNAQAHKGSAITAEYLLEGTLSDGRRVYIFLDSKGNCTKQFCKSFFIKSAKDYSLGQPRYTLLKRVKIHVDTEQKIIQYDKLSE